MNDDERLVHDWLCERSYLPEYEPAIVATGRKPDFLVVGRDARPTPQTFWAEVKSLQPENSRIAISKSLPVLKEFGVPENVNGHAMLHVNENTRQQSIRALLKMFFGKVHDYESENVWLVFLQQNSEATDVRYLEVESQIVEKVWVRGARNETIAVPAGRIEDAQAPTKWSQDGKSLKAPAFRIFDWQKSFDCALVVRIEPHGRRLTAIASMSGGNSNLSDRALGAIENANAQLRNAHKFKQVPGIVFIVPAEDYADDLMIAIAAYGQLTVPISRESLTAGEGYFGRDGAFRAGKNTHIGSLIRLRRKGGPSTYFPNPFAKQPIDERATLFTGLQRANVTFR
jgi:hypothetical protein